jgi:CBS domain-containing protein
MRIDEAMTRTVISVSPGDTVGHARDLLKKHKIHHLLVVEKSRPVGVVTIGDITGKSDWVAVSTLMTHDVVTLPPSATLREAAAKMIGRGGCLAVVDADRIVGIMTTTDMMRVLSAGTQRATA